MSFHGFPWFSLTILLYHSLLPAGFLDYIPWPVVVDKFLLVVQHLHICVNRSIVERRLWVLLYFSSSVSRVLPWLSLKLYIYIYIYINIYIYIMSFHGFPWFSLTILLYHSLLPAGFLDYIPWPVVVDKFLLVVQHLHICVNRSIVERRLWVLLYFSSSVSRVLPWLSLKPYIYIICKWIFCW